MFGNTAGSSIEERPMSEPVNVRGILLCYPNGRREYRLTTKVFVAGDSFTSWGESWTVRSVRQEMVGEVEQEIVMCERSDMSPTSALL